MPDNNQPTPAPHTHDWRIVGQSHERTYYECACGEEAVGL